jgi:hypothetical protein
VRPDRRGTAALAGALLVGSLAAAAAGVACGHTEPFATLPPGTVGPFPGGPPRQLTFNPLPDETASVHGDTLVFSRLDVDRADGDRCLAFLPVEGGRLQREACARGMLSDSTRDAWLYPAISPDGRRVAFVRERGSLQSSVPQERALVVAPLDAPDSAVVVVRGVFPTPTGQLGNAFQKITWRDDRTLRFLGGVDSVSHGTLSGFVPLGVFEIAADAAPTTPPVAIPELADAVAYDLENDGSVYFIPAGDPIAVHRWVPDSAPALVVRFDSNDGSTLRQLTDVAFAGGVIAAIGIFDYVEGASQTRVAWIDLAAGGSQQDVYRFVAARRLAGVPGRRLVVLEAADGGDPDLWLVGFP